MRRRREVPKGEETIDVARIEDAKLRVLLDLEEDLKERFFRQQEESKPRRVDFSERRSDGDGLDRYGDLAGVREAKFLEENHRPVVGGDLEGFDLGGGGDGEEAEEEEEEREAEGRFRHFERIRGRRRSSRAKSYSGELREERERT